MSEGIDLMVHIDEIDIVPEQRVTPALQLLLDIPQQDGIQLEALEVGHRPGQRQVFRNGLDILLDLRQLLLYAFRIEPETGKIIDPVEGEMEDCPAGW